METQSGNASALDVEIDQYAIGTVVQGNYKQSGGTANYMIQVDDGSIGTIITNNTQLSPATAVVHNQTTSANQSSITILGNRTNASTYTTAMTWVVLLQDPTAKTLTLGSSTYASFSGTSPSDGTLIYCSDCKVLSACASGGTGAFAKRIGGTWVCN